MSDARARRGRRQVRPASVDVAGASPAAPVGPFVLADTPLVISRSLGALLGLEALAFKVESVQPTGSWLDRGAAVVVRRALDEGATGLCLVGCGPLALPLAAQCARTGLRLVVLSPSSCQRESTSDGWLAALGSHRLVVGAELAELSEVAPWIADRAGLLLVDGLGAAFDTGLGAVAAELDAVGHGGSLLVVPALIGTEPATLASLAMRRPFTISLPLDGLSEAAPNRLDCPFGVVGDLRGPAIDASGAPKLLDAWSQSVISVAVTAREADAARRLLAREEGLTASRAGASALAGLVRAVREDRRRRPREQRLPRDLTAVVVIVGDPPGCVDGPAPPADGAPSRAVSLAELMAEAGGLLGGPSFGGDRQPA